MTLQLGRDGKPEVHTDAEGRRYGVCLGDVRLPGILASAPPSVREAWAAHVRCGRWVPLPGSLAGNPPSGFACNECGVAPAGPPEEAGHLCDTCSEVGDRIRLNPYNRVASSRTGVSLHQCRFGHFTFTRFPERFLGRSAP